MPTKLPFKFHTFQEAAVATGNGTVLEVAGFGAACLQVIIATTATVTFEATVNGQDWVTLPAINTSGTRVTAPTASGVFWINTAGLTMVRARVSAWTSGAVTVTANLLKEPLPIMAAVDVTALPATPTGTNSIGTVVLGAGSAAAGSVTLGAGTAAVGTVVAGGSATAGGCSMFFNSALTNSAVAVKATAGQVYSVEMSNALNAAAFVQLFNVAAASVTLATTVPNFVIAGPTISATHAAKNWSISPGMTFGTAIAAASTTTATGNGAAAQVVSIAYV